MCMNGRNNAFKNYFYLSLIIIVLSSCGSRKNLLFNTGKEKHIPHVPVYELKKGDDSTTNATQIIEVGDLLFLRNLQNNNLVSGIGPGIMAAPVQSLDYKVEKDSMVTLPVIGRVKLGGMSIREAETKLNHLYKSELLNAPLITLQVSNAEVTFLGEFNKPGNYSLAKNQVHLLDLIGESGGFTTRANKKRIKIIRGNKLNPEVLSINLEDIQSLSDKRLYLMNHDVIYAEPKGIFNNLDQITPITSVLGIGLTILNTLLLINSLKK